MFGFGKKKEPNKPKYTYSEYTLTSKQLKDVQKAIYDDIMDYYGSRSAERYEKR